MGFIAVDYKNLIFSKRDVLEITGVSDAEWIDYFRDDFSSDVATVRAHMGTGDRNMLNIKQLSAMLAYKIIKKHHETRGREIIKSLMKIANEL